MPLSATLAQVLPPRRVGLTIPEDFPGKQIDQYISKHHRGFENAEKVKAIADLYRVEERRLREYWEADDDSDVCTSGVGCWHAETFEDYEPALKWRRKRLLAEARATSRLKKRRNRRFPNWQPRLWKVA